MSDAAPAVRKTTDWLLSPRDMADVLGITPRQILRETGAGRLQCAVTTTLANGKTRHRYTLQNLIDYVELFCTGETALVIERAKNKLAA
jgi:hypothetical protein